MPDNDLPDRLKRLRVAANLTQKELGRKVGVVEGTVSKWERGEQGLSGTNLVDVARVLGVTVEELAGPTDNVVPRGTASPRSVDPGQAMVALAFELVENNPGELKRVMGAHQLRHAGRRLRQQSHGSEVLRHVSHREAMRRHMHRSGQDLHRWAWVRMSGLVLPAQQLDRRVPDDRTDRVVL